MAGQINALIPLKVQAPDFAGSLSSGVDIGNALLMAPIERKLKEAQAKYYSENAGSNSVYGTPIFGTDEAGNTVLGAFDKRGMFHRIDTGGVTPTPGVRFLDLGTSVQGVNIKSGQPVGGPIPKDVSGRAAQEKIGEATGTAQTTLPTVADNVGIALGYIDQLKNEAKDTYGLGDNPVSSMFANVARNVPGTESFGFQQKVNQLKGTAFLQAYNTLRGSGQISNIEGEKAEQALARLNTASTRKDFEAALDDFANVLKIGLARAQRQAQGNFAPAGDKPVPGATVLKTGPGADPNGAYFPQQSDIQALKSDPRIQKAQQALQLMRQKGVPEAQAEAEIAAALKAEGFTDEQIRMMSQ